MQRNENLLEALQEDFKEWPGDDKLVNVENLFGLIMVCIEFLLKLLAWTASGLGLGLEALFPIFSLFTCSLPFIHLILVVFETYFN
jgi:hypothetical protein